MPHVPHPDHAVSHRLAGFLRGMQASAEGGGASETWLLLNRIDWRAGCLAPRTPPQPTSRSPLLSIDLSTLSLSLTPPPSLPRVPPLQVDAYPLVGPHPVPAPQAAGRPRGSLLVLPPIPSPSRIRLRRRSVRLHPRPRPHLARPARVPDPSRLTGPRFGRTPALWAARGVVPCSAGGGPGQMHSAGPGVTRAAAERGEREQWRPGDVWACWRGGGAAAV